MNESSEVWYSGDHITGSGMEDTMDTNTTCQSLMVRGNPLPVSMATANTLRHIQIIHYLMIFVAGSCLNCFIIYIIARFKKLHSITYYFALQIILTNQGNALTFTITAATNAIADRFIFTGLCPVIGFIFTFLRLSRSAQMLVLVADRFSLVFMPFWYARHRVKVVLSLTIISYVLAFFFSTLPLPGLLSCYAFQRFTWSCVIRKGCENRAACALLRALVATFLTMGPFTAFVLYLALLRKAKKLRNRVGVAEPSLESEEVRKIRRRRRRSERKANTTFLILFIELVGVSVPAYLLVAFGEVASMAVNVQEWPPAFAVVSVLVRGMPPLIIVLDPIAIMKNQEVREVIKEMVAKFKKKLKLNGVTTTLSRSTDTDS